MVAKKTPKSPATKRGSYKRSPELEAKLMDAIASGASLADCSEAVGIDRRTLQEWRKDPVFSQTIKSSLAAARLALVKRVNAGQAGWQGSAWILERRHPDRFSLRETHRVESKNLDRATTEDEARKVLEAATADLAKLLGGKS